MITHLRVTSPRKPRKIERHRAAAMFFLGRMLASQGGITLWEHHQRQGYILHLIDRGLTIELDAAGATNLLAVLETGLAAARNTEAEKDVERRLQIMRARVTDFIRQRLAERDAGAAGLDPESL